MSDDSFNRLRATLTEILTNAHPHAVLEWLGEKTLPEKLDEVLTVKSAAAAPPRLSPEQQLAAIQFRNQIRETAIAFGMKPRSVELVLGEAEELFERQGDRIVARDGRPNPHDPTETYDVGAWLADLRDENEAMFEPQKEH